jgi:hypothetical protein
MKLRLAASIKYPAHEFLKRKEVKRMEMEQDMVVMKGGRMMVMRNGEMKDMDMVMTLANGTKVSMDGTAAC